MLGAGLVGVGAMLAVGPARAQESASFVLHEQTLNQGGRPRDGSAAASPGFALTLDAIGAGVRAATLSGPSFTLDGGFVPPLAPPAEVDGVRFDGATALAWMPAGSAAAYHVYRGELPTLQAGGAGSCRQAFVPETAQTIGESPPAGEGYFFLVTGVNRLLEESSRGRTGAGVDRGDADACP